MINKLAMALFFSGVAALMYQVLWVRMLGLVFGNTVYSISVVLGVFMGGLALGSYFIGRYIDKQDKPLKTLAIMEGSIGVYCALTPFLFSLLTRTYVMVGQIFDFSGYEVAFLRFVLSSAILLFPTFLMGGTLPVIIKAVKSYAFSRKISRAVGFFYGVNTLGAAMGAALTGFVFIRHIGVTGTLAVAVIINLFVSAFIYYLYSRQESCDNSNANNDVLPSSVKMGACDEKEESLPCDMPAPNTGYAILVLLAAGMSGFMSMVCEVIWTRTLALIIGMSVYSFATMLCSFLFGIAIGSFIFTKFFDKLPGISGKKGLFAVGIVFGLLGITILLTMPVFNYLPILFLTLFTALKDSFFGFVTMQILISFSIMLIPAVIFGFIFPFLTKIYFHNRGSDIKEKASGLLGGIYAFNTLGAIAGAVLSGFVFISLFGLEGTIRAAGFLSVAIAVSFVFFVMKEMKGPAWAVIGFLIFATVPYAMAVSSWDKKTMTSGVYQYAPEIIENARLQNISVSESFRQVMGDKDSLYYKDGVNFSVTVLRNKMDGVLSLAIDGKVDASNNYFTDMNTQILSGHLPLLFHKNPKKVLIIGLASGITLGAVARHPVEEIDCVEIEPAMIEAAGFFEQWNHSVLKDPRVKIIFNDARNYLLGAKKKYDVIISEPSNPWISAASPLFTKEYFELIQKRLNPGGVFCQWMQMYGVRLTDVKSVLATVKSVFPDISLWNPFGFDTLIMSTPGGLSIDYADFEKRFVYAKADAAGLGIKNPLELLIKFVTAAPEIEDFVRGAKLNTDDKPLIEFSAPKSLYDVSLAHINHKVIQNNIKTVSPYITTAKGASVNGADMTLAGKYISAGIFAGAESELKLLARKEVNAKIYNLLGYALQRQNKLEEALEVFEKSVRMKGSKPDAFVNLSQIYLAKNETEKAVIYAKKALAVKKSALSYNQMGLARLKLGHAKEAAKDFAEAYKMTPSFIPSYINEAIVHIDFIKNPMAAIDILNRAISVDSENADVFYQMGRAMNKMGMLEQAAASFNQAIQLDRAYKSIVTREIVKMSKLRVKKII